MYFYQIIVHFVGFQIRLRHKYHVENGETLLVLNDNRLEKVHTRNALKLLSCGKSFPWMEFWNEKVCQEALKLFSKESNDTIYGLYFSAHWVWVMVQGSKICFNTYLFFYLQCPPCKAFIPQLIHAYNSIKKRIKFEIIFISSDRYGNIVNNVPFILLLVVILMYIQILDKLI